ncbi:GOLPH3/VPS74 family protein [Actinophytocola gossypii]|uniref:GPP34 family phosphoprotein n=1 Tax=Actinophytocola gossypii TaxID=2812003 RepID=A0ABT2J7T6_9PSEU|nr:GPP34 family phosphoprotein [Actinophytocola gossypii]MCT2583913.1 GPP34 family phosphoprotein [Actinophytocola gossypii]
MASSQLPGLRLADEFFLAAHDHEATRMRPRLQPVVLSLGLTGALLTELMLDGRVGQTDDYILAANLRAARTGRHRADGHGSDEISEQITERIARHPGQPVSAWLSELRHDVTDGVVARLFAAGLLREVRARRWWGGSSMEYHAVDPNRAMGPEARIFGLMRNRGADTSLNAVLLAGLVDATGLREKLPAWDLPATEVRTMMSRLRAGLPAPLHHLLADVETSVGAALLSTGHH